MPQIRWMLILEAFIHFQDFQASKESVSIHADHCVLPIPSFPLIQMKTLPPYTTFPHVSTTLLSLFSTCSSMHKQLCMCGGKGGKCASHFSVGKGGASGKQDTHDDFFPFSQHLAISRRTAKLGKIINGSAGESADWWQNCGKIQRGINLNGFLFFSWGNLVFWLFFDDDSMSGTDKKELEQAFKWANFAHCFAKKIGWK